MEVGIVCCAVMAGAGILQALLLLLFAVENVRYFCSSLRYQPILTNPPRLELFVPCKGAELLFDQLAEGLLRQDYGNYGVTFIVESADDPAHARLQELLQRPWPVPARILVAGRATDCGQKVHNLLAATANLDPGIGLLAFADSDIQPSTDWIRRLVHPILWSPAIGAVTGYRWFLPTTGNLPGLVLAALNGNLVTLLGKHRFNALWGGSWAIRRETFDAADVRGAWRGALTDDLTVWRAVRKIGLFVLFEPGSLAASAVRMTWRNLADFARRQYLLTRVYAPSLWWTALAGTLLYSGAWWGTLGLALWRGGHGQSVWLPGLALALLQGLNGCRSWLRCRAVARRFPEQRHIVRRTIWFEFLTQPVLALFNLGLLCYSACGRQMTWRGIRYRLDGPTQTRVLSFPASDSNRKAA